MFGLNFGATSSSGGVAAYDFGNALLFDGVNDYVSFTSFAITSTTTLSCWFKYSGSGDGGNIYGLSSSANLSIRITSPTQIRWYDGANNNWTVASMGAGWHHIMIARSGTDTRCYVDGVESSSGIRTSNSTNIDQIGRYYNGTIVPLNGTLDEVAITTTYTATLADAVALYNGGSGSLATDTLSGVRRYYQFNSSSGTVAIDAGTDADNGTLNNFTGTYWVSYDGSVVYDADAQTYFDAVVTAGGSLGTTFKDAYNTFVLAGKSEGWYSGLMQFNPCAGGNEASCEINAISPGTLDDTYVNSPTIDATIGVTFDGTTQYADTGLDITNDFAANNNWQIGAYHITGFSTGGTAVIIGAMNVSNSRIMLEPEISTTSKPALYGNGSASYNALDTTAAMPDNKMLIGQRIGSNRLTLKVGTTVTTNTANTASTNIAYDFSFGARNKAGVRDNFTDGRWACKFMGEGMTDGEVDDLSTAATALMAAMGL